MMTERRKGERKEKERDKLNYLEKSDKQKSLNRRTDERKRDTFLDSCAD